MFGFSLTGSSFPAFPFGIFVLADLFRFCRLINFFFIYKNDTSFNKIEVFLTNRLYEAIKMKKWIKYDEQENARTHSHRHTHQERDREIVTILYNMVSVHVSDNVPRLKDACVIACSFLIGTNVLAAVVTESSSFRLSVRLSSLNILFWNHINTLNLDRIKNEW